MTVWRGWVECCALTAWAAHRSEMRGHAHTVATLRISLIMSALALASGCTTHLRPKPDVPADGPKLQLKAALVVPPGLEQNVDDLGGFNGISGSYAVDTGQSLLPAVQEVFARLFQSVNLVNKVDQAGSADVVIVVKTLKMVHPRPG